jgi:methyl-accepting chemotaxis protein
MINTGKLKFSMRKSINVRITVLFLVIVLSLAGLLTVIIYNQISSMMVKDAVSRSYKAAEAAGQAIDAEEFTKLKTVEDEKSPAFEEMREELEDIKNFSGAKYVYTMRKTDDGMAMYVIDGAPVEDMSHLGDTEEWSPEYDKVMSGEVYSDNKVMVYEEWGALISTYYPIKDGQGTVIGFAGVASTCPSSISGGSCSTTRSGAGCICTSSCRRPRTTTTSSTTAYVWCRPRSTAASSAWNAGCICTS